MSKKSSSQSERDNRAIQLNPNNDAYWKSRGLSERPSSDTSSDDTSSNRSSGKPE